VTKKTNFEIPLSFFSSNKLKKGDLLVNTLSGLWSTILNQWFSSFCWFAEHILFQINTLNTWWILEVYFSIIVLLHHIFVAKLYLLCVITIKICFGPLWHQVGLECTYLHWLLKVWFLTPSFLQTESNFRIYKYKWFTDKYILFNWNLV